MMSGGCIIEQVNSRGLLLVIPVKGGLPKKARSTRQVLDNSQNFQNDGISGGAVEGNRHHPFSYSAVRRFISHCIEHYKQ